MEIDKILGNMLIGEPLHDGIVIGIVFICFATFYKEIFSAIFAIFK